MNYVTMQLDMTVVQRSYHDSESDNLVHERVKGLEWLKM